MFLRIAKHSGRIIQACAYHKIARVFFPLPVTVSNRQKKASSKRVVFHICLGRQCDSQNYFGFVVNKFSEHRQVLDSCVITMLVTGSSRAAVKKLGLFLRIPLPKIQNIFLNRFAFPKKHQMLSIRFGKTF